MDKLKIAFIINPISGVGKQKKIEQLISKTLNTTKINYQIIYTQYAKHATKIAAALKNVVHVVAVVGGDGSVHEVASALLNSNTAIAIIPTGSGNGLARHLNIPLNIKKAILLLNNFKIKKIDTGLINNISFINVAGVGFDAFIIKKFSENKKRGLLSYIKIIISTIFSFKSITCKVNWKKNNYNQNAFMVCGANITQFGNAAYIAPKAKDNDGELNLVIIKKLNFFQIPILSFRLFTKTLHLSKLVIHHKVKEFTVQQQSSAVQLDGEYYELSSPLHFKVNPLSLSVLVPK